jgi:hypothetical protein
MEGFKVRIVNRGLEGEPHHYCFQSLETNKIIEFSSIQRVRNGEDVVDIQIQNSDLENPHISDILNKYGHETYLYHIDDGEYEIIF